jgi:hypothetical protein
MKQLIFSMVVVAMSFQSLLLARAMESDRANVELLVSNVGTSIPVEFKSVLPGRRFDFTLTLRNKTGSKIVLDKLSPSCGCMVPSDVVAELGIGEEREIPIKLNVDSSVGPQKRLMKITDTNAREWSIEMTFNVDSPLSITARRLQFTGKDGKPEIFKIPLKLSSGIRELENIAEPNLKCHSSSLSFLDVSIEKSMVEGTWDLRIVATPKHLGLAKTSVESIEFSCETFRVVIPFELVLDVPVRYSPPELSSLKLSGGTQRLMVHHDSPNEEFTLIGVGRDGEELPIKHKEILRNPNISVFIIGPTEVASLRWIEVFPRKDTKLSRVKIPIGD